MVLAKRSTFGNRVTGKKLKRRWLEKGRPFEGKCSPWSLLFAENFTLTPPAPARQSIPQRAFSGGAGGVFLGDDAEQSSIFEVFRQRLAIRRKTFSLLFSCPRVVDQTRLS